ncbi:MAG: hypothetical protein PVG83_04265 [Acidimicrobiia bacterium]|jgi:hypothetical protein
MGEVLGDAMTSLAHTWRRLLIPALSLAALASVATVVIFRLTGGHALLEVVVTSPDSLARLPDEIIDAMTRPYYQALALTAALHLAVAVLIALISQRIVLAHLTGSPGDARTVWARAARRYGVGLGSTLLVWSTVVVLLGVGLSVWMNPVRSVGTPNTQSVLVASLLFLALIAPGLWVGVAGSMTTPTAAVESTGIVATIRRSFALVRGRWMATAGFMFLIAFLGGVSIALIQFVALPLAASDEASTSLTVVSALGVLTQGLLIAAVAVMCTHWYLDLRVRKERLASLDLG